MRARVRIRGAHRSTSVEPLNLRIFQFGEELEMMQWGRSGQQVGTGTWWTSQDLDAAHSVPAQEVLEGELPAADR